jgi:ABC-type nitrate/sulfonate/bicarbonate transport system substrate-binding protein
MMGQPMTRQPLVAPDTPPDLLGNEVFFSICPRPIAAHIALEQGWLGEELARVGARAAYLRSIPDPEELWPHVSHRGDTIIRDGGCVPPIWARADVTSTRLVGITYAIGSGGHLLVRADADIWRVADLTGKRVGLPKGRNTRKIDFLRTTPERGIKLALLVEGLSHQDVDFVDIIHDDRAVEAPSPSPSTRVEALAGYLTGFSAVEKALLDGKVDAIYADARKSAILQETGRFKVIEDLGRHPDWTLGVNNTPLVTTVSERLASEHPEIVVAWLRATIRAGRWINNHRRKAAEIFNRAATRYANVEALEQAITGIDFIPALAPRSIIAVGIQKRFLLDHGYIRNDFNIDDWVDGQFLVEAHASLNG